MAKEYSYKDDNNDKDKKIIDITQLPPEKRKSVGIQGIQKRFGSKESLT